MAGRADDVDLIQNGPKWLYKRYNNSKEMIQMENSTKSSGLLLGTLIGGAIGAASAFLLAPKSGAKLREDIANKYHVINDRMQQMATNVGDKTQDIANSVSEQSTKLTDKVSEIRGNVTDKAIDVKDKFTEKTNEVKNNVVNAWQDSKAEVKREADSHRQPFSS
ncbi:YtxH domain-containing protein [Paenibacillus psychroresistens]|uniref:YtxH domain-containing protein n=2 Tax=Paenibacillus psychroresistens TaxID=1778678 RepID=A0A6B8RT53_9BACL|nr:YtxH domain-containing protein [Paenibacillus psychroresistens]